MPAIPACIQEPLWDQFIALLPTRQVHHPLGCQRRRITDCIVFDKLIQILVFGCGYRRIADHTCSATTLPCHRDEWITLGVADQLHRLALAAYDRIHGLDLEHLAVDGCITKRRAVARSPGQARWIAASRGSSARWPPTRTGCHWQRCRPRPTATGDGLLVVTLDAAATVTAAVVGPLLGMLTVHLDAGDDDQPCRQVLADRGMVGRSSPAGCQHRSRPSRRWPVERTHAWANQDGKPRWCTERRRIVVQFWLLLALALIVVGRLIRRAWTHHRLEARATRLESPMTSAELLVDAFGKSARLPIGSSTVSRPSSWPSASTSRPTRSPGWCGI
jgi:hypothetical protein